MFSVRAARADESATLQQIERDAGRRFGAIGMPDIADDDPPPTATLVAYASRGRSWVAVDDSGGVIGYVLVDVVDDNAHVEQLSVAPPHQGRGVGRALLDHVQRWAVTSERPALSLTTFRDVEWNAPLYEHLGFRSLDDDEIGPELRALRDTEAAHGLDPTQRVCMLRVIEPGAAGLLHR